MTEHVYKVVDDLYEIYYVVDASEIINTFGKVTEVTKYRLMDPVDITDAINGGYIRDEEDYD